MLTGTRPSPATSSMSAALPVGSSLPVLAPPGSMNSSRMGAPVPATPSSAMSPATAASSPSMPKRETMIFLVLVLWMRTTAVAVARARHQPLVDRERADGRRHVPAVAVVVDARLVDQHLRERVVDVGIRVGRRADHAHLGERRHAAAHAVELAHAGVGRADHGQEDRLPLGARGRQVAGVEHDRLGRAAAHEHGGELLLWHGSPPLRLPPAGRAARSRTRPSRSRASP